MRAVEHVDFHAPAGKVTAPWVGSHGAGKTTLMLVLASSAGQPRRGMVLDSPPLLDHH